MTQNKGKYYISISINKVNVSSMLASIMLSADHKIPKKVFDKAFEMGTR